MVPPRTRAHPRPRPAGGGREEGPGRPPWFPQHGLPPPGSHPVPGWALPYAAPRPALQARWPAFRPCCADAGVFVPRPGVEAQPPLWKCRGMPVPFLAVLGASGAGEGGREGRARHLGAQDGGGAVGVWGLRWASGWGEWHGACRLTSLRASLGRGLGRLGQGVAGHTPCPLWRGSPRPCWKASRKSPRAAPCPEWAPPLLSTKGGVRSSGNGFLPGTCGPRDTLVTGPAHSPRPAPPRGTSVPQA